VNALLRSPHLFDALALLVVAEWGALAAWRRATGRGPALRQATSFLGAGFFLFVALRGLAAGDPPAAVGAALVGALACHAWHLAALRA
jgi:hypothetical protein